ncbi:alpha/beta fold hydrolase [Abditibacterium utsteinense]|nr:alpha/beta fold hydrolase [Abditibacterium utsteinense]
MLKNTRISPTLSISYRHAGEVNVPPLIFLHAFPLSSAMWQVQIDEFSKDFEVFAPDFRGIGQTSGFDAKPSIQTLASDLAIWLEEMDVYAAINLCGLSMGGYVALEFARQFPEKLRGLIFCDTRADADTIEAKKARNEMQAFAKENNGRAIAQKMLPKLLGETTLRENPRIPQKIKEIAAPNSGENLSKLIAAMRDRRDSTEFLPEIKVPTLVLGGREDAVSSPEFMTEMAAKIPNAKHVVIEGAGHLSNLEKPQEFNAAIRDFLNSLQ